MRVLNVDSTVGRVVHGLLEVWGMEPLPHRYVVSLFNGELAAPPRDPIAAGRPPQFGGSDRVWSPEELLVAATLECLWTTFEAYARRDGLVVQQWNGCGIGVLERAAKIPEFTSIELDIHMDVAHGDEQRARALLAKAEANCIIANALRVPVVVKASVISYAAAG